MKTHSNLFSFWEKDTFLKKQNVIVLGSGIVGLSAAIHIKQQQPKWSVLVVDRGSLPLGGSTKNAGFACFGSMTELLEDLKTMPEEQVWKLVEKRWEGLNLLQSMLGKTAIDFEKNGGYEIFQSEQSFAETIPSVDHFNDKLKAITGFRDVFRLLPSNTVTSFGFQTIKQVILNQQEGQLHPGKMIQQLIRFARSIDIEFLNGMEILQLEANDKNVVFHGKNGQKLKAEKALVATNGFSKTILPELDVRPARNQVLLTKPVENLPWKGCFHFEKGFFYFRNVGKRILVGGGRHLAKETEQTDEFGTTPFIQKQLLKLLREVILPKQEVPVEQWWSGILGVGPVKSPIVQQVDQNITVAVRMGGMGIAIGSIIGKESAAILCKN